MKQAKIQISADVRGFKKQMDEARQALSNLGNAQISSSAGDKLKNIYGIQLSKSLDNVEKKIKNTQKTLETMAGASAKTFDANKYNNFSNKLIELKKRYKEIKDLQQEIASGKVEPAMGREGAAGSKIFGGAGRMLTGLAGGLGMMTLVNRREQMADQRLRIRSLTTNGQGIGETSALGFTPEERRERAAALAGATPASGGELTSLTNMGEQLERAFGIQGGEFAGAVGEARKAGVGGVGNQMSLMRNVTGMATGAGLQGPQIGEYLQSMTGYLSEMSKGVNIDADSLNGFASAMSSLPFFKSDPARAFDALRSMNQAFTQGDEFQKAQAIRAIGAGAPGSAASSLELRREMGLFGQLDKETMGNLKGAGVDTKALGMSGGDIVNNIFKDIMASTKGMNPNDQLYEFIKRSGLSAGAGASIFGQLKSGKGSMKDLEGKIREAQKTPEERLADTFKNSDGTMKSLTAAMARVADGMAENVANPIASLGMKIDEWIRAIGGNPEGIAAGVGTAAVVGAAGIGAYGLGKEAASVGKGAAKGIGKGMKGAGRAAKGLSSAATGAGKGLGGFAKTAGKGLGKAAKVLGPLGMLASLGLDVHDIATAETSRERYEAIGSMFGSTMGMVGGGAMGTALGPVGTVAGAGVLSAAGGWMGGKIGGLFGTDEPMNAPEAVRPTTTSAASQVPDQISLIMDNTMALRELTDAIRGMKIGGNGGGGGFKDKYPSNASFAARSMVTGK